jgi:hypothetical protein
MQPEEMTLVGVDDHLVEPSPRCEGKLPTEGAVPLGSIGATLNV